MDRYMKWIAEYLGRHDNNAYGLCKEATAEMVAAFPELVLVRGHVECPPPWNRRAHWWLTTPSGDVVDPTASQFPFVFSYEPWKEGDSLRLGRCMECGAEIWGPNPEAVYSTCICDATCEAAFAASME